MLQVMAMSKKNITRRKFISDGVRTAGLVGLGGAIGVGASRFLNETPDKKSSGVGNVSNYDLTYDLSKFTEVNPSLIQYEEVSQIKAQAQAFRSIAVGPEDRIYVTAGKTISIYNKDTEPLSKIRLSEVPRCLTVTNDGILYIGMKDRVEVYNPKGICEASGVSFSLQYRFSDENKWENLGQNAFLTSIAVSEKDVFVADAGNRIVLRYDNSGKLVRRIGKKNKARNIPGFSVPSPNFDLAVAPDGLLRVANPGRHRVEAYTFDGDLEFSWGKTSMGIDGFCGCCNPVSFDMLPDGRCVTCEKGLPRVKIYDSDGVLESVVAGPKHFGNMSACSLEGLSDCQKGGLDVAVDSQGRVLVLDPTERIVRIFTKIRNA